jgi:apolipoprotein N-acyltransferase
MVARSLIAGLASGLMLWLASPAVGVGWLAWVALVPAAVVVLGTPGSRGARLAIPLAYALCLELLLIPALPFGLADGQWGDPPIPVLIDGSPVLAVALVAIPLLGLVLYAIRFGEPWGAALLPQRLVPAGLIAVPALAWTALDFARANLDPGGLWGPLFLSQADQPAADLAVVGGPWLITLAIVAVNYGIALALVRRQARHALVPAAAALAIGLAGSALGPAGAGRGELTVAAIQPGYDTAEEGRPQLRRFEPGSWRLAALDLIRDLGPPTRRAARAGAEVVVWPQASIYVDPRTAPRVRGRITDLVETTGIDLVVPFFRPYPVREDYVIAAIPTAGGARFTEPRPKQRALWFLGENSPQGAPGPLELSRAPVGVLLGVDAQDPLNAAALAEDGAEVLVSPTHDWRQSAVPQRAYARLAAVASHRPLVRADWRYGSAVYSADGETLASAGGELRRTIVVADVVPQAAATPYARLGDVVGWAALLALSGLGLASLLRARGRKGRKSLATAS